MFDHQDIHLGISPQTWIRNRQKKQNPCSLPLEQILSEAALAGFSGIESTDILSADSILFLHSLKLRRLAVSSHLDADFLLTPNHTTNFNHFQEKLQHLTEIGTTCMILHTPPCPPIRNEKSWSSLFNHLQQFGRCAAAKGIRLCYHPRIGTGIESLAEIDRLLAHTDSRYISLCYDTGYLAAAGEDPLKALQQFGHRIGHVYLRDVRPEELAAAKKIGKTYEEMVQSGCFTVPGDGCISYDQIFASLDQADYNGWLVVAAEQPNDAAEPFEYALKANYYLRALLEYTPRDIAI